MKRSIVIFFLFLFFQNINAQLIWTKQPLPVLSRSAVFPNWKGLATADAFVMKDNDTLKMWYSGSGWLTSSDNCVHVRMGYAWSLNGTNWTEYAGNPVLNISTDTSMFDSDGIETPTVIKDLSAPPSHRYKLWYAGRKLKCSTVLDHKFGYAYSPDGIHWTKYSGNPVMTAGNSSSWYNTFISNPSVIFENNIYKMWFTAPDAVANSQPTDGKGNIGYATSPDGINWSVYPAPVILAGSQNNWDSATVAEPSVIKVGNMYHMFYSALDKWLVENFQVGYANSMDGINWTKATTNPVLKIGTAGKWDRYWASHPAVMYDSISNKFKMWYTGRDTATIVALTGYYWDIGYAESSFTSLGMNDLKKEKSAFYVYPNPATEYLTIKFSNITNFKKVLIYNYLGILIKETEIINSIINISNLEKGIYFLNVEGDEAHKIKFIKE